MNNELTPINNNGAVDQAIADKRQLADLMSRVLKKDEHYGIIPGTHKPTLYKAGAEIIARTFGIHATMEVTKTNLKNGHREYEVICRMYKNSDGMPIGEGVGMCSTMEKKYRWRTVKKFDPKTKKQVEEQIENPNLEDLYNTILKMAKKRAYVDAVISSTAASDFVTQDLEDYEPEPEPWEAEIEMIDNMEELKKYWVKNKGKGARFDQAIMKRKAILENNQPKKDEDTSDTSK